MAELGSSPSLHPPEEVVAWLAAERKVAVDYSVVVQGVASAEHPRREGKQGKNRGKGSPYAYKLHSGRWSRKGERQFR
jgi:hypothetical protein